MSGEVNLDAPQPVRHLADILSALPGQEAEGFGLRIEPWKFARVRGRVNEAHTSAAWRDPVAGQVSAAVVLRPKTIAAVEWGITARAKLAWSPRSTPPASMLDLVGEGVCDPSGAPITDDPMVLPVEDALDRPEMLEAILSGLRGPDRLVHVLLVAVDGKTMQVLPTPGTAVWPGLVTMALVTETGRRELARLVPQQPIPGPGGARFFAAPGSGLDDQTFGRNAVRTRPGAFAALLTQALAARQRTAPTGPAARARELLDRPVLVPAPARPVEPARDKQKDSAAQLKAARQETATVLGRLREQEERLERTTAQLREAREEIIRLQDLARDGLHARDLARQLADADTERQLYAEALETTEAERDQAVRERGLLAARLAELTAVDSAPTGAAEREHTAFTELLADAPGRYDLLVFDHLDLQTAAGLDRHPKAAVWRRRTSDTLATMQAYARAKQTARRAGQTAGPQLADLYAFVRSGAPGVLI